MRSTSLGIYLSPAVKEELKRVAERKGKSFSQVVMEIVKEGLEEVSPEEIKNTGSPTSISVSPEMYDFLREYASRHGFLVGYVIRKLLERWYWRHKHPTLVEG